MQRVGCSGPLRYRRDLWASPLSDDDEYARQRMRTRTCVADDGWSIVDESPLNSWDSCSAGGDSWNGRIRRRLALSADKSKAAQGGKEDLGMHEGTIDDELTRLDGKKHKIDARTSKEGEGGMKCNARCFNLWRARRQYKQQDIMTSRLGNLVPRHYHSTRAPER